MTAVLLVLLIYAVLTMWVEERWAWAVYQLGVFAVAGCRLVRFPAWHGGAPAALLALAAAWPAFQTVFGMTLSRGRTEQAALDWLTFLATFVLVREAFHDARQRPPALRAISVFGLALAAVATVQHYTSNGLIFWVFPSGFQNGVLGPFVNRNQFAAWVELLLPVPLYLAVADRRFRALHVCSAAVLFGSLVAAASRAGFLLAVLEVPAVLAIAAARRIAPGKALAAAAVQFAVVAAVAGTTFGWQPLASRMQSGGAEELRWEALRASMEMMREHPWTGTGLGTWSMVYPRYAAFDSGLFLNQAHNDWAQWAAEGGIPFAVLMLCFAALLSKRAIGSIYGLGTVVFLVHALVDYPMQQRPALAAWFFAIGGAAMAWRKGEPSRHDGLLRRARSQPDGLGGGDPASLQASRAPAASGSL